MEDITRDTNYLECNSKSYTITNQQSTIISHCTFLINILLTVLFIGYFIKPCKFTYFEVLLNNFILL